MNLTSCAGFDVCECRRPIHVEKTKLVRYMHVPVNSALTEQKPCFYMFVGTYRSYVA